MAVHTLTRAEARRIAVSAQLLDAERTTDLVAMVRQLTFLQLDPTAAVAPSADLVAYTRMGAAYRPALLQHALEKDRTLFELDALVRPMDDLKLHRASMKLYPEHQSTRAWLEANEAFRRDVLAVLRERGPVQSREIRDTAQVPWPSTGWTNNRNVTQMLEILSRRGEVATAGRVGRQRLWDLPERVYPAQVPEIPEPEARRLRAERRLRALGIARASTAGTSYEPGEIGEIGEQAVVEGVPGTWRVDPAALGRPFTGRTALLSPFDRLVHDRVRLADLFEYEYILEMYKPRQKRRWGYFALPVLHGDRLVGKVDAAADRKLGVFTVNAVHRDVPFTADIAEGVRTELRALAGWLGLELTGARV